MADETRTLVGTWIDHLKSNRGEPSPTEKEFNDLFKRELKALLETLVADVAKLQNNPDKIAARVEDFRSRHQPLFERLEKLRSHYATRYRMWAVLSDLQRQHSRAVTIDHLKLFASRASYALLIAAVVLGTGYLAKLWNIPLPMLRPLGL